MKVMMILCFFFLVPQNTHPDPDLLKLAVESNHSTIQFSIPISNGLTRVTGKFTDFSIDIDYVDDDMTKSTIITKIKAASINTGIADRDEHLRTADFFDVETYPEITFKSDSIIKVDDDYLAIGTFEMRGISKPLSLPLKITGKDGKHTIGFSSRLTIKRSDHGVGTEFQHTSMENFLGDEIAVEIDFWTKKRKERSP